MKKLMTLALLAFTVLAGCKKDDPAPEPKGDAAYFGTWNSPYGYGTVIISADKLEFRFGAPGEGFILEGLTWTPYDNPGGDFTADYPTGYKITGELTYEFNFTPRQEDGTGMAAVGDIAADWWYISTDGQSLRVGEWDSPDHEASHEFVKQP